jgi:hypothetical protein
LALADEVGADEGMQAGEQLQRWQSKLDEEDERMTCSREIVA